MVDYFHSISTLKEAVGNVLESTGNEEEDNVIQTPGQVDSSAIDVEEGICHIITAMCKFALDQGRALLYLNGPKSRIINATGRTI